MSDLEQKIEAAMLIVRSGGTVNFSSSDFLEILRLAVRQIQGKSN